MTKLKAANKTALQTFQTMLKTYKGLVDGDIETYGRHIRSTTSDHYGAHARLETDTFLDILTRGGKRIRGGLVMAGYEMCGGKNQAMIIQAARAIEMLHAYILIIDDIQDRSLLRRGGPTAHESLHQYHEKQKLAGDAAHFGIAVALNAALAGAHAAQMILANIDAPEQLRLNVLSIVNRTMVITAHGQTSDIMNQLTDDVGMDDIEQVMVWKTSQYSFLNPLHVGMVLAGADCHDTDAITDYAMSIGKAYQITDDITDTFGEGNDSIETSMDDIREGKRTVLILYALKHTKTADRGFLNHQLGNPDLSAADFERCKKILVQSGALPYAQELTQRYTTQALESLEYTTSRWTPKGTQFLRGLAEYIVTRTD